MGLIANSLLFCAAVLAATSLIPAKSVSNNQRIMRRKSTKLNIALAWMPKFTAWPSNSCFCVADICTPIERSNLCKVSMLIQSSVSLLPPTCDARLDEGDGAPLSKRDHSTKILRNCSRSEAEKPSSSAALPACSAAALELSWFSILTNCTTSQKPNVVEPGSVTPRAPVSRAAALASSNFARMARCSSRVRTRTPKASRRLWSSKVGTAPVPSLSCFSNSA
mmetsp:Transcript_87415/g.280410  ORF Transcript_87415/g.280410 Transcript_87415/m.280410 type:complete len:222 (-) Transcript_87415:962-1627(-)